MADSRTLWYSLELPGAPLDLRHPALAVLTAVEPDGFRLFVDTHMRAYGEEPTSETYDLYRLDVEEGVIDEDKMLVFLSEGNPVACLSYEILGKPDGAKYALVSNLGVVRAVQGQGFGVDAVRRVLNLLREDFGPGFLVLGDVCRDDVAPREVLKKAGFQSVEPEDWFPFPPSELR